MTAIDPYDSFVYPNYCYSQTYPDHLYTIANLFGLQAAPAETCRVLELACGDGANIIPMAFQLPDSQFLGVDRAIETVGRGKEKIAALGLKNIKLLSADIADLNEELGKFDYIIAHGLFSWVPGEIQNQILSLCRSLLNPNGVAYISYNAYPGCHMREIVRGILRLHTKDITSPRDRVNQSRALIKWLADSQVENNTYTALLREMSEYLTTKSDAAIVHDDLADQNTPFYFYDFVSLAAKHGLQFLSEAEYFATREYGYKSDAAEQLRQMEEDNILGKEQYLDFLSGRSFRQTLLCHQAVELERPPRPELVKRFSIRMNMKAVRDDLELRSDKVEEFRGPKNWSISTGLPIAKAAFMHLSSIFPRSESFASLVRASKEILNEATDISSTARNESETALASLLLLAFGAGAAQMHHFQPKFTTTPAEKPVASPLARYDAAQGPILTSQLHTCVHVDELGRAVLSLMDGTRDRKQLWDALVEIAKAKEVEAKMSEASSLEVLNANINTLAGLGFLVE